MENIIVAEGLRKEYDGFALEDVSFRVPGGRFYLWSRLCEMGLRW